MQSGSTPQAQDYYKDIALPDVENMKLNLEELVQQGVLTPEQAKAALVEKSQMEDISTDQSLQQAQMDALLGLQEVSNEGGLTAMDRAKLGQIAGDEQRQAKGAREAILQNAQSRGLGGSGIELMSMLQNQQDAATRQSQRDMDVAAMAQQRALDALMQGGKLAGDIRGQSFNEQATKANAADAIAKFNAQNQQQVNLTNTAANNAAQAANLGEKQRVADSNVGMRNQQQQYNKNLAQLDYENRMKRAAGRTGVDQANASNAGRDSQAQADAWNKTIGAVLGAGAAGAQAYSAQQNKEASENAKYGMANGAGMKSGGLIQGDPTDYDSELTPTQPGEMVIRKEDVPDALKKIHTDDDGDFDVSGFLDSITGYRYGYSKGKK